MGAWDQTHGLRSGLHGRGSLLQRIPDARESDERAAGQVERASQILRRLRTFIKKGEPELQAEDIAKLIEEGSAIALVGARERG